MKHRSVLFPDRLGCLIGLFCLEQLLLAQVPPQFSEIHRLANEEVLLRLEAPAGSNYRIDWSTNLPDWNPLVTTPISSGQLEYTDSAALFLPHRFYRAVRLPTGDVVTGDHLVTLDGSVVIHPIDHATFIMQWQDTTIYCDPVGGAARFAGLPRPEMILITDIHGDHLDVNTLNGVEATNAAIVAPPDVFSMLPANLQSRTTILSNGGSTQLLGLSLEAIPMYNTTPGRLNYHPPGRGNGYVVGIGGKRIYISGDTEDIPEMRALQDIDLAFVCMNLPYTMDVNQAASAVREFRPGVVYPYHYRGSDVNLFRQLVGTDLAIEVRLRQWYP